MKAPAASAQSLPPLWRNRAFLSLWIAQVVSRAGSNVTGLALPLTAVLVLGATPAQMALLAVAGQLPNFLFGLFAGVWVDRRRRRPLLVGADLGRALLLGSIPIAAGIDHLTFAQLWIVGFAAVSLGVVFQLATIAVLPALVPRERLVEANSTLSVSNAVLSVAGPGLAGALVQLVSAPAAILADAVSYLLSALSLNGIGTAERVSTRAEGRRGMWIEIGEGVRELQRTPILRALTTFLAVGAVGWAVQGAVVLLFLVRTLGFSPAVLGLIGACDGGAALVTSLGVGRLTGRIGIGPVVILRSFLGTVSDLFIPLAAFVPVPFPVIIVITAKMLAGVGVVGTTVPAVSLRQAVTPVELLGRVTAARRFLIFAVGLAGSALGGFLGNEIGLLPTLLVAVPFSLASSLVVLCSAVRTVHTAADAETAG